MSSRLWFIQLVCLAAAITIRFGSTESSSPSPQKRIDIIPGGLINVGLGTPEQQLRLLINTGSATTWVVSANEEQGNEYLGVRNRYNRLNSNTSQTVEDSWRAEYGVGLVAYGSFRRDSINLGGSIIKEQVFGETKIMEGFVAKHVNFDGVLGLGSLYPPKFQHDLIESMHEQKLISQKIFSLIYNDRQVDNEPIGQLVLGGIDHDLYEGNIVYVPIKSKWQIPLQSIGVLSAKAVPREQIFMNAYLDSSSGIIMLPSDLVTKILLNYPMHYYQLVRSLAYDDCDHLSGLNLSLEIGDSYFIVPFHDLVIMQDGPAGKYCISSIQPGSQYILGQPFLKNHYTIYDYDNMRVGLAEPKWAKPESIQPRVQQDLKLIVQNLRKTTRGNLYYATIGIGNQKSNLLIGTADPFSWVISANNPYGLSGIDILNSGKLILSSQGISYEVMGLNAYYDLFIETVTIANTTVKYTTGISTELQGNYDTLVLNQVSGILGLEHYVDPIFAYRSLIHKLKVYGKTKSNIMSLHLKKSSKPDDESAGSIIFGGIDPNLYTGEIIYVPNQKSVFNNWGLKIEKIQLDWSGLPMYQNITSNIQKDLVFEEQKILQLVMDSKERYFSGDRRYLDQIFTGYLKAIVIGTFDGKVSYFLDCNLSNKPDIIFTLENNYEIRIEPEYYIHRSTSDDHGCISTFTGTTRAYTFKFGTKFMENHYLVFDYETERVGFAQAA